MQKDNKKIFISKKTLFVVVALIVIALSTVATIFSLPKLYSTDSITKPSKYNFDNNVLFPCYTAKVLEYKATDGISLKNPNKDYLLKYVLYYNDEVIYQSNTIQPLTTEKFTINSCFTESGEYKIKIEITAYKDSDALTALSHVNQNYTFKVV